MPLGVSGGAQGKVRLGRSARWQTGWQGSTNFLTLARRTGLEPHASWVQHPQSQERRDSAAFQPQINGQEPPGPVSPHVREKRCVPPGEAWCNTRAMRAPTAGLNRPPLAPFVPDCLASPPSAPIARPGQTARGTFASQFSRQTLFARRVVRQAGHSALACARTQRTCTTTAGFICPGTWREPSQRQSPVGRTARSGVRKRPGVSSSTITAAAAALSRTAHKGQE